jgi:AcrR family transcriptional regulator
MTSARDKIQAAAFALFEERGYEATSVEDIATASEVSRSTFFRLFGTKEAVIFPDHDALLASVRARLEASSADSAIAALSDAVRLVLFHYVAEGERAKARYRLTRRVPALRDRELTSSARYQHLFRRFISGRDDTTAESQVRAELTAAAVVAAHNRVLRRWLRDECDDPQKEIDFALTIVRQTLDPSGSVDPVVVVLPAGASVQDVVTSLQAFAHS